MSRREEWLEQVKLSLLLDKRLDFACTFWTATDPVAPSVTSGAMRKKRGVKPGVPDILILYRGKLIAHRAEIAARPVQSVAAVGPRGAAAGGRAVVGGAQRASGDVGAGPIGSALPHAHQ